MRGSATRIHLCDCGKGHHGGHTRTRPGGFAVVLSVPSSRSTHRKVGRRRRDGEVNGDVLARAALLVLGVTLAAAVAWATIIAVVITAWRAVT
jgi:hypothetical protein